MNQKTVPTRKGIFKSPLILIAGVVVAGVVIGAVVLRSQPARYSFAEAMLERGEYADALAAFEALGDYKDAAKQMEEAEKGLAYLDAGTLLEQGKYREALALYGSIDGFGDVQDKIVEAKYLLAVELTEQDERKEACELFAEIGDYRDAAALLQKLKQYDQALVYMSLAIYEDAVEEFRALGNFRDAAEKAAECERLAALKATYEDGVWQFRNGKWLDAYRTLSSICEEEYEDTLTILDEISTVAEERVWHYAEQGERGKMLAFLRLMEEIDETAGGALRQELAPEETIEEDWSYFQFDPKCLTACSPDTQGEEYASTLLYMILNGETELTLLSDARLDKAGTLGEFYRGQNILGDITPGYGQVYNVVVNVQEYSMEIRLRYRDEYSEQRFGQIIETFETFCEGSLRELVAEGLLSASMSRRQKAELISEWVGFYLTYDRMKDIRLAGVAVEEAKGVCSAYASLYHRMCNLAGVPTYGQTGIAYDPVSYGAHIWLIHVDEAGDIFYADPTWADPWDIDFSKEEERPTVAQFADSYLERCLEDGVREYRFPSGAQQGDTRHFWAKTLWISHEANREAEDIIATHQKFQGKTP